MRTPRFLISVLLLTVSAFAQNARWTPEQAAAWYAKQPWLVGANYNPASAINQLEMWQADTFDPQRIDTELGWAASIGMNTMRVFLHDLVWDQDPEGYRQRIDTFLNIASKHGIRPMFVLFDSVWDPDPKLGKQREPKPGVHNSGWVQGPGAAALKDPAQHARLEKYVRGVVGAFKDDARILAWDIWNEPDNENKSSYGAREVENKSELVLPLMTKVFAWAREAGATQPLTSGVWRGDWSNPAKLTPMDKAQLELSDVTSFHSYEKPKMFERRVKSLLQYGRPILCTEYMARGNGSTFKGSLPIAKRYRVAAYNWGLVAGKTQTNLPWDSWKQAYVDGRQPKVWFHEVFFEDGRPYSQDEVEFIRKITGVGAKAKAAGQ